MSSFIDEFKAISELPSSQTVVAAMAKLANASMGYGAGAAGGGKAVSSANIPGMSIHCLKCGAKNSSMDLKGGKCQKCGRSLKPHMDLEAQAQGKDSRYREDNEEMGGGRDTGGKAAEEESLNSMESNTRVSKTANVAALNAAKGTAAIVGGLYSANELSKLVGGKKKRTRPIPKLAAKAKRRGGNPVLRLRFPNRSSPSKFLEALRDKERAQ